MTKRHYVDIIAAFCETGLYPMVLIWEDGRRFPIDSVCDLRPSASLRAGGQGDRYTIRIRGKQQYLFFEHTPDLADPLPGRWFIEENN